MGKKEEQDKVAKKIDIVMHWFSQKTWGEFGVTNQQASQLITKLEGVK